MLECNIMDAVDRAMLSMGVFAHIAMRASQKRIPPEVPSQIDVTQVTPPLG